jgi:hypothetical protein
MAGWSEAKVADFRRQFFHFLDHVRVNSKDHGQIILGKHLYEAQIRYLDAVFDSLRRGVHDIKHLKSRQLGISTVTWAFDLFWLGMFDGLEGVLILDTDFNKEKARLSLIDMIDNIPKDFRFPSRDKSSGGISNRNVLKLSNQSSFFMMSAGVRNSKTGGGLGRSLGVNFVHASEMCSWENTEGLEAFRNSLSTIFENRLYLWESTGRGFNDWWAMWNAAKEDPYHQTCHFTGWWGKNSQRISRDDPEFKLYGANPLSDEEEERIREVERLYGWRISPEQLAWIRRHVDPSIPTKDEEGKIIEASALQLIEQPWTEHDCFSTGESIFFDPKQLTDIAKKYADNNYKPYYYFCGTDFLNMRVTRSPNLRSIQLKVWEEPDTEGVYVVGVDPAFGVNPNNDRSAIQVCRCYGDGIDQVAEYAWPTITTEQLSWVIAHILGRYRNCYFAIEINGPGDAVWRSLKNLKKEVQRGVLNGIPMDDEFENIFANVKYYIYQRSDTMIASQALQMKTTGDLKITVLEELRDYTSNGMLRVRSLACLDEMKTIEREGDEIKASGSNKDDRVLSLAFCVHFWHDKIKLMLSQRRITRDASMAKRRLSIRDMNSIYTSYQVKSFFKRKEDEKTRMARMLKQQQRTSRWRR